MVHARPPSDSGCTIVFMIPGPRTYQALSYQYNEYVPTMRIEINPDVLTGAAGC